MIALNLLGFLRSWRTLFALGIAGLALAGWLYIGHLRSELKDAKEAEAVATRQAKVSDATSKAVDQVLRTEVVIRDRTEKAADAVQAAPGADDPVPRPVLDAWRSALHELRNPDAEPPRQGS